MYKVISYYTKYGNKYVHNGNKTNEGRHKEVAEKAREFIDSCPPLGRYSLSVAIEYNDGEKEEKEVYIIDIKQC